MSLKTFDDSNTTVDEDDDNYETPEDLYHLLCTKYQIFPELDVCADGINWKCQNHLTNALYEEWTIYGKPVSIWCNPPGSLQLKFLERAEMQYRKYNINILMIIPANCISTKEWHLYIEDKREYHGVKGRPVFLKNGKKTKWPSRNSYVVIVWRKT